MGTDNRLVWLDYKAGQFAYQPACFIKLGSIYIGIQINKKVLSGFNRHNNLFQRSIPSPFTNTIYSTFCLSGPYTYSLKAVSHRQTKVVMAMHANHCLVDIRYILKNTFY